MTALSEIHANPNLGVTLREKEIFVVTDSRIIVFWDKEVKKSSSYDSEGSKSNPIFSNITLSDCVVHGVDFSQGNQSKMQEGAIIVSTKENTNIKNKEMDISPQEFHTVQNILDTHVILYGEVKEEIVMQEEDNSIKIGYLPTNMTANVNVEEVRVKNLSIYEAEGVTKLFNLTLGKILRVNDFNSSKADKKDVSKDITKRD